MSQATEHAIPGGHQVRSDGATESIKEYFRGYDGAVG